MKKIELNHIYYNPVTDEYYNPYRITEAGQLVCNVWKEDCIGAKLGMCCAFCDPEDLIGCDDLGIDD